MMKDKTRILLLALSLLMAFAQLSPALAEPDLPPAEGPFLLEEETFGPLHIGMPEKELREIPCEWLALNEPALWGADGLEHWDLFCAQYGVQVGLARDPGAGSEAVVFSVFATAPCEWKTLRGAGIGDTAETLKALYGDALAPEGAPEGTEAVLIGSLYGGILAGIQDGLVTSLFFGAMAE